MSIQIALLSQHLEQMEADPDLKLAATQAALRDADAAGRALDARLGVARSLLAHASKRLGAATDGRDFLEERADDLHKMVEERGRRVELLHEGAAACELRLALSRQCLADSGRKLEALRARGGVAEEVHREKTIHLGTLGERLLERREQLRELTRFALEQRVRVGLPHWLPARQQETALGQWREGIAAERRQRERLRGAVLLWQSANLGWALRGWRAALRAPDEQFILEARRAKALRGLEHAAEARAEATSGAIAVR